MPEWPSSISHLIAADAWRVEFIHASGPGGQHVNKVATAVKLFFDPQLCPALAPAVCQRLLRLAGKKVTQAGIIVIDARRHRSQDANRQDAMERLAAMLEKALVPPVPRIATRPNRAAKEKRHLEKRSQALRKASRRRVHESD